MIAVDVDGVQFGVGDFDLGGIGARIEAGVDLETAVGGCRGDQVDDRLERFERAAAPVLGDEAEQPVLDLVPLRGDRREVADRDRKSRLVGELLQLDLPEPGAIAVRAAAVGGDLKGRGVGEALAAEVLPPASDRVDRERGGVVVDPDLDPTLVVGEVVDPVGDRLAELSVLEVVDADQLGLALRAPLPAGVLEIADELLLLGVDRDRRLLGGDRRLNLPVEVAKLRIAVGVARASPALRLDCRL
jgi:hypothetical protein